MFFLRVHVHSVFRHQLGKHITVLLLAMLLPSLLPQVVRYQNPVGRHGFAGACFEMKVVYLPVCGL